MWDILSKVSCMKEFLANDQNSSKILKPSSSSFASSHTNVLFSNTKHLKTLVRVLIHYFECLEELGLTLIEIQVGNANDHYNK